MSFLQTVITEILIMYLTYWTETKYVYAYTYSSHNTTKYNLLFKPTTNNSHNYHSYPSPINFLNLDSKKVDYNSKFHEKSSSNVFLEPPCESSIFAHTHTHTI